MRLLGRLFRRQAPDAGVGFKLGNILGLGVVFVARTRGLGLLLLVLEALLSWRRLASIMQSLFFFKSTGDLVGGAEEVKVLAYTATITESVIVEGIAGLIKLVGQRIVGVVEVEAEAGSVTQWSNRNLVTWDSHIALVSTVAIGKGEGVLLAGKEATTSVSVLLVPREIGIEAKEGHCEQRVRRGERLGCSRPKTARVVVCCLNHCRLTQATRGVAQGMRSWGRMRRRRYQAAAAAMMMQWAASLTLRRSARRRDGDDIPENTRALF